MRKNIWIFLPIALLIAIYNGEVMAFSSKKDTPWKDMPILGKSTLRVAIWDIYDIELLSADKAPYDLAPYDLATFALKIKYLRPVKKEKLISETQKQWQKLNKHKEHKAPHKEDTKKWLSQLGIIFPNVTKNDEITFFVDDTNIARFYLNDLHIGTINDPGFSHQFSSIWLSPKTSHPKLRKALIGKKQND